MCDVDYIIYIFISAFLTYSGVIRTNQCCMGSVVVNSSNSIFSNKTIRHLLDIRA